MMSSLFRKIALLSVVGFLTSSCGGGGGDVASGGISGTGIGVGEITGFGSIIVAETRYGTDDAIITFGDDPTPRLESELKLGMVVAVLATKSSTGTEASRVVAEEVVKGLVTAPAAADESSIEVLKQIVIVEPGKTIIDNSIPNRDIKQLQAGVDSVEVYGYVKDNGVIVATRIELEPAPVKYTVRGFVKAPAADPGLAGTVLEIGALTVNFNGANTGDMPLNRADWIGLLVEVDSEPPLFAGNTLTASKVEPEGLPQGIDLNDVDEAEIEGFITAITSPLCDGNGKSIPGEFVLSGLATVMTTATTAYEGGLCEEAVEGAKIEVEGMAGTPLIAEKIEFKDPVKLEGDVASKVGNVLTLDGLPGISVTVNAQTIYKGAATSLADIDDAAPDHVRIRGRATGATTVVATEVDDRGVGGSPADVILQGPVASAVDPNVVILGISVDTSGFGFNEFKGLDDAAIGRGAFFNAVNAALSAVPQVPIEVKAQGVSNGVAVIWDEIELED